MTFQSGAGTLVDIPVWAAAVEGNGLKILVDTGVGDPEWWRPGETVWQEPDETLDAALAQLGWRVNDIDIVINSHLHWDHSDNNRRLPNARFYVSLAEWEYAKHPISIQRKLYIHDWSSAPLSIMNYVSSTRTCSKSCRASRRSRRPAIAPDTSRSSSTRQRECCVWPVTRPASWRTSRPRRPLAD